MDDQSRSFGNDLRAPEPVTTVSRGGVSLWRILTGRKRRGGAGADGFSSRPFLKDHELARLFSVGGAEGDVSLAFLLRQSAHAIDRARALIAARGDAIARHLAASGAAEARMAAAAARLTIAILWLFIGAVLAREAGVVAGIGAGIGARGLDPAQASALARIFVAVGVLGAVAAFVGGFIARAASAPRATSGFGTEAGALARHFAGAVAETGDDAQAVTRLHCLAVEATSFFEGIDFLTEPDHARAEARFARFLEGRATGESGAAAVLFFALALVSTGAVIGALATSGAPAGAIPAFAFPAWVVIVLPGLALLYAAMGAIFAAAGAGAAGALAARARHETLVALRKAYVEAGAPRADDVIAAIETALSRAGAAPNSGFGARAARIDTPPPDRIDGPADATHSDADFAWRRPPAAPRFVARSFEAAPPVFRPEKQAHLRKNIFGSTRRNADPKQPASAPDAPPWLKD